MRASFFVVALCAAPSLAFPWMNPEGMERLLNHPEARKEIEKRLREHQSGQAVERNAPRQLGTGLIGGLVTLLGGTLEAVLDNVLGLIPTNQAVEGLQRFPEGLLSPYDSFMRDPLHRILMSNR
jgi:hypothetical protein